MSLPKIRSDITGNIHPAMEFLPFFRNGYGFDTRHEDGLASHREKRVIEVRNGLTLSKNLKRLAGFSRRKPIDRPAFQGL